MIRPLPFLFFVGVSTMQAVTIVPTCASLGNFEALRSAGACTAGVFTIKNITYLGPGESTDASAISLVTAISASAISIGFQSLAFTSTGPGLTSFTFGFTIDPPPDIIKGVSGELDNAGQNQFDVTGFSVAGLGDAISVRYALCAGAAFSGNNCAGALNGFSITLPDLTQADLATAATLNGGVTFASSVNTVGVLIQVDLSNGGSFSGLSSSFPLDVPEPASWAMVGAGLSLAAWRRRKSSAR